MSICRAQLCKTRLHISVRVCLSQDRLLSSAVSTSRLVRNSASDHGIISWTLCRPVASYGLASSSPRKSRSWL